MTAKVPHPRCQQGLYVGDVVVLCSEGENGIHFDVQSIRTKSL